MVSIEMLKELLEEMRPKRLLVVGDEKQLPCIKGFSVLSTLLRVAEIPRVILTRNHRQTEASALARTIDRLSQWTADGITAFSPDVDENFQIVQCVTSEEMIGHAVRLYHEHVGAGGVQMLAFTNPLCTRLNDATKNTQAVEAAPGVMVGDRIVCTQNLYDKKEGRLMVANGVIGEVKSRFKVVYENNFTDYRDGVKGFHSKFVTARAMTVHKSQGNEFEECGIILLGGHADASSKLEYVYTALSRFKRKVYLLGTRSEINRTFRGSFNPAVETEVVSYFNRHTPDTDIVSAGPKPVIKRSKLF
jgi:ATP-dependent exoDNAse (exonuclease V) alpha subunit